MIRIFQEGFKKLRSGISFMKELINLWFGNRPGYTFEKEACYDKVFVPIIFLNKHEKECYGCYLY